MRYTQDIKWRVYAHPLDPCVGSGHIDAIVPVSATVQRRNITYHCLFQVVVLCISTLLALYRVGLLYEDNQLISVTCMVFTATSEERIVYVYQVFDTLC